MIEKMILAIALALFASSLAAQGPHAELIKPSAVDPRVKQYDESNVIIRPAVMDGAPLAVFFPGTGGKPEGTRRLGNVVAGQGYRFIGLEYNDVPSVQQVCPLTPNPECAGLFREMRVFGTGGSHDASNPLEETIAVRLTMLLQYLDKKYPTEHWNVFLTADGKPAWSKMVLSGLSQGAGMAAFIAKKYDVARVVLFSSPVDMLGGRTGTEVAPWLRWPSATPVDRWYAERNSREPFNPGLIKSYPALSIPVDHIKVFDHDLPAGRQAAGAANPMAYHGTNVADPSYTEEWKFLYGVPTDLK